MRDFRDAKAMAQAIRAALAAKGVKITIAESLELTAKAFGAADWNTLAAAIKAAPADKAAEPPPMAFGNKAHLDRLAVTLGWPDWEAMVAALRTLRPREPAPLGRAERPQPEAGAPADRAPERSGTFFSPALEASLHRAVALAAVREHGYTTLEHLLLALSDDPDAAEVMEACQLDAGLLKSRLVAYIDEQLKRLTALGEGGAEPSPTAGFHRVLQRAVVHVQSSGRGEVTGANVLVAIFSERESHACAFLEAQRMTRNDAVNFIARGVRKGGAAA